MQRDLEIKTNAINKNYAFQTKDTDVQSFFHHLQKGTFICLRFNHLFYDVESHKTN